MTRTRLITLFLHIAVFLVLGYGYKHYIATIYAYEGFVLQPVEWKWYFALVAVAALSVITPTAQGRPSTLFLQMTVAILLIPMLVMFHAADKPTDYVLQVLACYVLTVVLVPLLKIRPPRFIVMSNHNLRRTAFALASLYIVAIFAMGGARYLNFDLLRVYDFRSDAASNLPVAFAYISPIMAKVIVPIAFVLSLIYRRYLMAAVFVGFSVLIFGLTAHKSTLFFPLMIFFVYVISRGKWLIAKFNLAILALLLAGLADFAVFQNEGWVANLMMRRQFFVPGQLNYIYYEFFSQNGLVYFSNSKITFDLIEYPYPLDVAHLIGLKYFDDERTGANTGWLGSGYMQAGFLGMLLYAAIIAAIFKYIDSCASQSGERALVTASAVVPVYALITSSDLLTALLTHGLYVNLLIIACLHATGSYHANRSPDQRPSAPRHAHLRQAMP